MDGDDNDMMVVMGQIEDEVAFQEISLREEDEVTQSCGEVLIVPPSNSTNDYQHQNDSDVRVSSRRKVNLLAADGSDGDDHNQHGKDSADANLDILALNEDYKGHVAQHYDEDDRWDDVSFHSEGKTVDSLERSENKTQEERNREENHLLSSVTRWFKIGLKIEDSIQNQPSRLQPFSDEGIMVTTVPTIGSNVQESVVPKQENGSQSTERISIGPVVKRWWTSSAAWRQEDGLLPKEEETSHNDAESIASHASDDGSPLFDYDETSEMVSALDWLRSDDQVDDEDHGSVASGLSSVGNKHLPIDPHNVPCNRTPEQRSEDLEKVVEWMKKGKGKGHKREDKYDPTKEYRKLESMLPKRKGTTPEERANEIEGALDWLRNQDGLPASVEEESTASADIINWNHLGLAPICLTSPEDRLNELENVMNWIRNKGQGMSSKLDPNGNFRKLDRLLPRRKGQRLEDRGREIEGVLDWMRNSELVPDETSTLPEVAKLETFHAWRRTPEQRAKDLNDVMLWMSQGGGDTDESTRDPAGRFSKLNLILEVKEGQSNEDRAREIECSLDWLQHNDWNGSLEPPRGGRKKRSKRSSRRRKQHRDKSPEARIPKLIGGPLAAPKPNLLASIGRVVSTVAPPSDVSTIGTTDYPDQKDFLIDKANKHTFEMASAIAFLVEPEAPSRKERTNADDIFGSANENWWESPDSVNSTQSG